MRKSQCSEKFIFRLNDFSFNGMKRKFVSCIIDWHIRLYMHIFSKFRSDSKSMIFPIRNIVFKIKNFVRHSQSTRGLWYLDCSRKLDDVNVNESSCAAHDTALINWRAKENTKFHREVVMCFVETVCKLHTNTVGLQHFAWPGHQTALCVRACVSVHLQYLYLQIAIRVRITGWQIQTVCATSHIKSGICLKCYFFCFLFVVVFFHSACYAVVCYSLLPAQRK